MAKALLYVLFGCRLCLLLIFVTYLLTIEVKVEKWRQFQKWVKICGALSTRQTCE